MYRNLYEKVCALLTQITNNVADLADIFANPPCEELTDEEKKHVQLLLIKMSAAMMAFRKATTIVNNGGRQYERTEEQTLRTNV